MSIFSALFNNKIYNFEQAFNVKDITSTEMQEAIRDWFTLYFDGITDIDTTIEYDDCQRLPVLIVNKIVKTAFSEYEVSTSKTGSKADFVNSLLLKADAAKKTIMQFALIGGECFIKPVLTSKGFELSAVRRDCFIPLARDVTGRPTSVGTAEFTSLGGKYYTLLERRTVGLNGALTIESKLYVSDSRDILGTLTNLNAIEKYATLQPIVVLPGIYNLGMALVKTPMMNSVDGTNDGVSIYSAATKLIKNINRNEQQLNDEFDNGASRIIASNDMITTDSVTGKKKMSSKLFIGIDDDQDDVGVTIFNPNLREASYLARKQEYLRNIESLIGLKRGILSEVEATERTATEITSSQGDYNLTIIDFQQMWESALRELIGTCDRLGQLYKLCDSSLFDVEKDLIVDWGDGVLFNRDKAWAELSGMVGSGMLKPEIAVAWYYDIPFPKTPADLEKIREMYMPELEQLTEGGEK